MSQPQPAPAAAEPARADRPNVPVADQPRNGTAASLDSHRDMTALQPEDERVPPPAADPGCTEPS